MQEKHTLKVVFLQKRNTFKCSVEVRSHREEKQERIKLKWYDFFSCYFNL